MPRPRKYPPELLGRGARLVFESGRPIAHVARDLGGRVAWGYALDLRLL
jgi:transposase